MRELRDIDFLMQKDWRESIIPRIGKEQWITVYDSTQNDIENSGIYCALIPNSKVEESLSDNSWDLMVGNGMPGCSVYYDGENETVAYHRFGDGDGIEPLVFLRDFHGVKPDFLELSEEFRHFHNLFFKSAENAFIKITDDGEEEIVVRMFARRIQLRLRDVREFLAIKEMHLAIFFDVVRYSVLDIAKDFADKEEASLNEDLTRYNFHIQTKHNFPLFDDKTAFSRLLGKKMITPLPKEKSRKFPYDRDETRDYEDFIIGIDENSDPITYTCNPDKLANYFGKNPDAPHYLTPVFFRREVLGKYYSNSDKYSVEDGCIRCAGLWLLRIDNNHSKHIIVYLGDLGRDINYSEQKYWKSFNVLPDGKISNVELKRGFLAEFADPESPDLLFKLLYKLLNENWETHFGWKIFLPLTQEDAHFLTCLRIPINDSQTEFDAQVLALTKVIIDSLNEKQITDALGGSLENEKGISKLERFFVENSFTNYSPHISFLRDLQDLRSKGTAHRKGSQYPKIAQKFDVGKKSSIDVFESILSRANDLLKFLEANLPTPTE